MKQQTRDYFSSVLEIEAYLLNQDSKRTNHYSLERITKAVQHLDNPHKKYKVIHVGGTSGKGSTCRMIESILRRAGYKVGLFTSPAIVSPLERIQVNGKPITEKQFISLLNKLWPRLEPFALTYFEFFTIMALGFFAEREVDYTVIEVGMGGRFDATNVVDPLVAIVTTVGLDHTKQLGKTRASIAREKEQIIKRGCIGLTGSKYVKRGRYIDTSKMKILAQDLSGTRFSYKSFRNIELSVVGKYQIHNAILAIEAAQAIHISAAAIKQGLKKAQNPGRFEVIARKPLLIVDGAHNPEKMRSFVSSLTAIENPRKYNQVVGLIALKHDKDVPATLRPLVKKLDVLIITGFSKSLALTTVRSVARTLNPKLKIILQANSSSAFNILINSLKSNDMGIITGSLYMIGDLKANRLI